LSVDIASPEDGEVLSANVIKVYGTVSDSGATVTINDTPAHIFEQGDFYSYVELQEGENVVEVVSHRGNEEVTETVRVFFKPALWIYYDWPLETDWPDFATEDGIDYTSTPINIAGYVSDPTASVILTIDCGNTINEIEAIVDGNSFSANVVLVAGHNCVCAIASRNDESARKNYSVDVTEDGQVIFTPGKSDGSSIISYSIEGLRNLEMSPGETKSFDAKIEAIRERDQGNLTVWYSMCRETSPYCEEGYPPDGLEFFIEPSSFEMYPNTIYNATLTVTTHDHLKPGTYYLCYEYTLANACFESEGIVEISILPK